MRGKAKSTFMAYDVLINKFAELLLTSVIVLAVVFRIRCARVLQRVVLLFSRNSKPARSDKKV